MSTASEPTGFLKNIWYQALPGRRLKRGGMTKITLAGEPILLARDNDGQVFGLRDICPHRGIPLSCGKFDGKEVECCYHGWRFNGTGQCTAIPSLVTNQEFKLERIKVKNHPAAEIQGNIWVFIGDADRANTADIPRMPGFPDQRDTDLSESFDFPCHVDHAVIGLMDPAHGPFVHASWWWRSRGSLHDKAKRFGPSPLGFTMLRHSPSKNSAAYKLLGGKPETEIAFSLPGIRLEHIKVGENHIGNMTAVTPVSETETVVHQTLYWSMGWPSLVKPVIRAFARRFVGQDREVVVQQQEGLKHNPTLLLINDADVQARWYYRLKAEHLKATAEGRPFENPLDERTLHWRS